MNSSAEPINEPVWDLRPLRCFLAVAGELHFGRAAARLVLPQSTVSERVRQLEAVVGGRLFERSTRSVALTPLGEALVPEATRALAAVEHTYLLIRETAASGSVPLILGTAMDVDTGELADALSRLRREHPDLKVSPALMRTGEQVEALLARRLHLGYAWEPPQTDGIDSCVVAETGVVAFVPFDHGLATRTRLDLAELCEHPLVAWSSELNPWTRRRFETICRSVGAEPLVVAEAPGFDAQARLVLAGVGIGVTAASISTLKSIPGLVNIAVDADLRFRRSLIWRHDETHPGVSVLRALLIAS